VDGATLNCATVAAVARRGATVTVAREGLARATASHRVAMAALGRDAFYGRTTGVGANNKVAVKPADGHGLRLLRSHAGGAGALASAAVARGTLAVRLNQLAAGGSSADPAWLNAAATALNAGLTPEFPVLGGIGTGDLTALAATALPRPGPVRVASPAASPRPGRGGAQPRRAGAAGGAKRRGREPARGRPQRPGIAQRELPYCVPDLGA
jgi:histidine ammonia-lyase